MAEREILLTQIELQEFKMRVAEIGYKKRAELTEQDYNELIDRFNSRSTVAKIERDNF
jgi:hypothetical protein